MTILCYHSVEPNWESPLAMSPADFERHCAWISGRRRVVSLTTAVERLDSAGRLPWSMAALTLDDGFEALYWHALPLIRRYRLPSTVFLVAETLTAEGRAVDWVRTPPPWPLKTLNVDQVLEMQDAGVDFQSHSWAHRDLPALGFDACLADLRQSRELLEDLLRRPVRFLAYPRGLHNEQVRRAARLAGYSHAFSLPESSEAPGPYSIPRVGIHRGNSALTLRVKSMPHYLRVRTAVRRLQARASDAARSRSGAAQ